MEPTAPAAPARGYEFDDAENQVIRRAGSRTFWWGVLTLATGAVMALVAVLIAGSGEGFGLAFGVIYGLLALIPIFVGLYFVRSGRALKAVVDTTGRDVGHLMRALDMQARAFTIQIVAVLVWVGLGVLAALAIPKFGQTREMAYYAAMRSDLRNLATAQELYTGETGAAFTYDLGLLQFYPSEGVEIDIRQAGLEGWSAVATHAGIEEGGCAIYVGDVTPPTTAFGSTPAARGEVACDR